MEVLFITHKYPPSIGGMETQSFHLVQGMKKYCKTHVIKHDGNSNKIWFYLGLKRRVKKYLKSHPNISIVHCNDGPISLLCAWISNLPNIKLTGTIHGLDVVFPLNFYQSLIKKRLTNFDHIFTVSQGTYDECLKRGIEKNKLSVAPNGVDNTEEIIPNLSLIQKDIDRLNIDKSKTKLVISLGRAVKRKGFSWFIKNVLTKLNNDVTYIIVGPYDKEKTTSEKLLGLLPKKLKNSLELLLGFPTDMESIRQLEKVSLDKNRFYHLGKLPFDQLQQWLKFADLFVMPNQHIEGDFEGFGLVMLEANLAGKLVLATGIEGITDAIHHNKNGIHLPHKNPQAWIDAIDELFDNEEKLTHLSQEAQNYASTNFAWDKMVDIYYNTFSKL